MGRARGGVHAQREEDRCGVKATMMFVRFRQNQRRPPDQWRRLARAARFISAVRGEVDEDLADDVLDGAVTDAGIEPVVVADDIGEGVHALGGFVGQLVDLGFDVFGGLFGGHEFIPAMLDKWPGGGRRRPPRAHVIAMLSGFLRFNVSMLRICAVFARAAARARAGNAVVAALMGWLTPTPAWTGHPPLLVINVCQKYIRSKNPEAPRIFYCFAR
jgi:hypothetical protein